MFGASDLFLSGLIQEDKSFSTIQKMLTTSGV